ncbi:MAG: hypothetical protein HQL52_15115 [Magnetococcales bacterium]|nr:hypothetical protein [Magnetococcales bacterium]
MGATRNWPGGNKPCRQGVKRHLGLGRGVVVLLGLLIALPASAQDGRVNGLGSGSGHIYYPDYALPKFVYLPQGIQVRQALVVPNPVRFNPNRVMETPRLRVAPSSKKRRSTKAATRQKAAKAVPVTPAEAAVEAPDGAVEAPDGADTKATDLPAATTPLAPEAKTGVSVSEAVSASKTVATGSEVTASPGDKAVTVSPLSASKKARVQSLVSPSGTKKHETAPGTAKKAATIAPKG